MDPESLSSPPGGHMASCAVRDWLETQAQILAYWREVLVSANESEGMIQLLDDHARFLQQATRLQSLEISSWQ